MLSAIAGWLSGRRDWPIPVGMGLLLFGATDYQPFPSVDHFVYVPLAWRSLDPDLYARDLITQSFPSYAPVWELAVRVFEPTVGLAVGFWLASLALTVATLGAVYRLTRALSLSGLLLPLVALIGLTVRVNGVGRGLYGGALGDTFHAQWLALCLLLWTYDALVRRRPVLAGVLLGLTVLSHPVVGAHGAFVVAVASAFSPPGRWRRLLITAGVTGLVSLPLVVPLSLDLLATSGASDLSARELIELGYLFRTPHEFTFEATSTAAALLIGITALAGLLGAAVLFDMRRTTALGPLFGVFVGQGLLLAATVLVHGPLAGTLGAESVAPYQLHLSRTSPLFIVLGAVLAIGGLEATLRAEGQARRFARLPLAAIVLAVVTLLLVNVAWNVMLAAALLIGVVAPLAWWSRKAAPLVLAAFALFGAAGLGWAVTHHAATASVAAQEAELFAWAGGDTALDSLFIVPPGFESFRLYSRRGAYVDFKLFPSADPRLIAEWRARLEQVAALDRLALDARGWPGLPQWDRTYANRNTPRRIADLLEETGADYFVWDADGLDVPPYVPVTRPPDPRLTTVFQNGRFEVYQLRSFADAR